MPRVFISYTHDSQDHRSRVLRLAQDLRQDGIDAVIDAFINGQPDQGWPLWMETEISKADFVLAVFTQTYSKRFTGNEHKGVGLGGIWESGIVRDFLYSEGGLNRKIIPVLFDEESAESLPATIRYRYTRYFLPHEYDKLLRYLTGQPPVVPRPLGPPRHLPPMDEQHHNGTEQNTGSECGISYEHLKTLLQSGRWKEANDETTILLIRASGRENYGPQHAPGYLGFMGDDDVRALPCRDLIEIDSLWVSSSNGRFGFSVQARIIDKLNGDWHQFCEEVGWYVDAPLTYALHGPIGHLPTPPPHFYDGRRWWNLSPILNKLAQCRAAVEK